MKGMIIMLDSFTCPFCNHTMPVVSSTYTEMDARYKTPGRQGYSLDTKYSLKIHMYKCPNCQNVSLEEYNQGIV